RASRSCATPFAPRRSAPMETACPASLQTSTRFYAAGLNTSNTAIGTCAKTSTAGYECVCAAHCANAANAKAVDAAQTINAGPMHTLLPRDCLAYGKPDRQPSNPCKGEPPTGEPYAGDPHVRFGGRGGPN